ncbi:MAG: ribosome maturation factor RimM [Rhizobiales bacterium]|nr:ribosome maturation factor RimM [Hyphomicrobiales bacterium]
MACNRVCVAQIGAPHGVRGEVRLWVFTEDPAAITRFGPLEIEDGSQRFEIEQLRPAKRFFVARLRGVADRTAAERLSNASLYVPRGRLPPPEDDETFYHADLIGLTALDQRGDTVGTVLAVRNFGAGDLLEIQPAGRSATVLLPFSKSAVPAVDVAGGRIVIDPPEGTFED